MCIGRHPLPIAQGEVVGLSAEQDGVERRHELCEMSQGLGIIHTTEVIEPIDSVIFVRDKSVEAGCHVVDDVAHITKRCKSNLLNQAISSRPLPNRTFQ